jgi:aspartyl-tRNA(Asn)/glutamyl-tRNA(Gln) amidotransferase subunit B
MEQGTMRADANISLRPAGTDEFNTKVEVKNMNSIHHVGDAIAYEIQRQTGCMERNETVTLHTRLWDPDKKITVRMREKFAGPCVPDPCVPSIHMDALWLEKIKKRLPEMPDAKASRFVEDLKLPASEAFAMSQDIEKDSDPERIISEAGLEQVSDTDSLEAVVDEILAAHPDDVSDYKNGNPKVIGFFMGLAMKASKGKANPKRLKEILSSRLDSR